jgi:uncharacterized membrane protein
MIMTLSPLLVAPVMIQIHVAAAMLSLLSGAWQALNRKSGPVHKTMGWVFVTAMTATAISSFWISGIRPDKFSPIHLLSILTLITLPMAVYARRTGNIKRHKWGMIQLFAALVIAGAFTLLPGRIMHTVAVGNPALTYHSPYQRN